MDYLKPLLNRLLVTTGYVFKLYTKMQAGYKRGSGCM
jgi:hypothetical protein